MQQTDWNLPAIAYGAVYFRKSNPPRQDWERDYARAASDGMNVFRHWFLWGAIETAPGQYDWEDYDAQFELGAKHGIKTIVAECLHSAPEWAFRQFADARYQMADGVRGHSQMRNSSATGGFPGLCLDNEKWKNKGEEWLSLLVNRYKDHPAMGGYDIWNECNLHSSAMSFCYCDATQDRFRAWLHLKYGDLKTLAQAWRRYSFASWDDVEPPKALHRNNEWAGDLFPDFIDWTLFRIDNAYRLMQWRVEVVKKLDPTNFISCHGVNMRALNRLVSGADNPWRAAELCDGYGYTGGCSHYEREVDGPGRWAQVDLARSGAGTDSDGVLKPFWAAERSAGPSWSQKSTRARDNGRIPQAADLRVADLTALAGGANGLFSSRWRPLLDGPLFDHYAYYHLDGSPTERSKQASSMAKWANAPAQADLWRSRPTLGDIGLVVVPEAQIHLTLLRGEASMYAAAVEGAHLAFRENNLQADFVPLSRLDDYDLLYLAAPYALADETVARLKNWVEHGGTLISEGPPAYWNERGRVHIGQPGAGLSQLFGALEAGVEFMPELVAHESSTFQIGASEVANGGFWQSYALTTGRAAGHFQNGEIAVVDNTFGRGRTRLIGTSPGLGFAQRRDEATRAFFAGLLGWAGKEPHLKHAQGVQPLVQARLHQGAGGTYLWIISDSNTPSPLEIEISARLGPFESARILWGGESGEISVSGQIITGCVPAMDGLVVQLVPRAAA